jgi:F-type H+-transporting ATPase subunit gamma
MESLQKTKNRIAGVKNINQITKAMELVAATKMRKSQEVMLASRPYAYAALDFLANLSKIEEAKMPELLRKREIKKIALIIVASDKGLAGSFNSNIFRNFENYLKENNIDAENPRYSFIAFGQKANNYLERKGIKVENAFLKLGDFVGPQETKPLADFLTQGYLERRWDKVLVFSQHFRSALKQDVLFRQILPVEYEILKDTIKELVPETGRFSEFAQNEPRVSETTMIDYIFEPAPEIVLEKLAEHLVEMQIYHLILEANASEHAARRMAMKSASDNAEELAEKLTLEYNKSRQAAITKEIIEIVAGAEAAK